MTDEAIADWKELGDAYFGLPKRKSKQNVSDLYDLFEFFMEGYAKTSRERLLELVKGAPNFDELKDLPEDDLRLNYCEMLAGAADRQMNKRPAPMETPEPGAQANG